MQWVFKPKQNSMEKTIDVLIDYEFKSVDNKICMIYPIISMNTWKYYDWHYIPIGLALLCFLSVQKKFQHILL